MTSLDAALASIDRFLSPARPADEPISQADLRALVAHIGARPNPDWMPSLQPRHPNDVGAPRFDRGSEQ